PHHHDDQSSGRGPFQVSILSSFPPYHSSAERRLCQNKRSLPTLLLVVFRREREQTAFSFYLESEWAGGQRVDKAGKGLLQVWKRQIQQFNRVSPDVAAAILAAYPSPQLLKKVCIHIASIATGTDSVLCNCLEMQPSQIKFKSSSFLL
ncbi:hypothetical protein GOODEAATRI_010483, partial [Goodea atripinnis]